MEENIYQEKGYKNRKDYLECLAAEYCVPLDTVYALASVLGKNEDFDGLISSLEDVENITSSTSTNAGSCRFASERIEGKNSSCI